MLVGLPDSLRTTYEYSLYHSAIDHDEGTNYGVNITHVPSEEVPRTQGSESETARDQLHTRIGR